MEPTQNYIDPLMDFLQVNQIYFDKDPLSPAFMAVQWLADEAQIRRTAIDAVSSAYGNGLELNEKLIQRFALLTLDFALLRPNATAAASLKMERNSFAINANNRIAQTSINIDYSAHDINTYRRTGTIAVKGADECFWEGIVCASVGSRSGKIEEINFSYSGLSGTIPPEIKLLRSIKKLDLAGNELRGSIPDDLYYVRGLEEVYLHHNHLTGPLSNSIGNWWNL